jgi:antimicrobial peptide system SdpB family protein
MPPVTGYTSRLLRTAYLFDPRSAGLALGRSLLAVAQLTVILCSPDSALFEPTRALPSGMHCDGVRGVSLWCAGGAAGAGGLPAARVIAVATLALVAVGYRPRWTCLPHWYVTFSLSAAITLPIGGDRIAAIATGLLIPVCLGDDRVWQWVRPGRPMDAGWRGRAYAAFLAFRVQVALIYGWAVVSKLASSEWRHGTALYTVVHDPNYGLPSGRLAPLEPLLGSRPFIGALTWGTLAVESAVAVGVLSSRKVRRYVLPLGVLLHAGTIMVMGLFSFGLVMIGVLLVACLGDRRHEVDPGDGSISARPASPVEGVAQWRPVLPEAQR